MNILLTHGYFIEEDPAEQKIMMPYPPQGLLHISAYLSKHGISSSIFDTTFSSYQEFTAFLSEKHPSSLGIYCNLLTRINIIKFIRFIRNEETLKNMVIILGGPDVRYHAENYLSAGADFCVIGEGEETLRELLTRLEGGTPDFSGIQGIAFKGENGDAISTPERSFIKNLDELPFPDFNEVPLLKYFHAWKKNHGISSVTVSTMRGCPYSCKWCSKAVYGNSYRRRSPEKVVMELLRLTENYHADQFWFVDDVFTISKTWMQQFRDHLIENNLKIRYECITRADKMDEELIQLLKESGCFRVWIGGESGSQKVLDRMDRRVSAAMVREMIILSKKAGMETGTFLMLGYPGETLVDIKETLHHLKLARPDNFTLTLAYPIKGTAFYEEVANTLRVPISGHFGDYSDRDHDFRRTYPPGFYKHAIRYLNHHMAVYNYGTGLKRFSLSCLIHRLTALLSGFFMSLYQKTGEVS